MDPNFRLIRLVDPSKSASKIKDRFAKLTLSSHKKRELDPKPCQEQEGSPLTRKSHSSRKLFDDCLTDDDSDSEADALNRIFRSKTTAGGNGAKIDLKDSPQRRSKSLSQRLQMSDSDETNCSLQDVQDAPIQTSGDMGRLEVSPSQHEERESSSMLLPSNTAAEDEDIPVHQISSRLSSLALQVRTAPVTSSSGERLVRDDALENIFKQQVRLKEEQLDDSPRNRRVSILTISSADTSPISLNDNEASRDSDVVVISESDEDSSNDDSYPVSAMRETHEPNLMTDTMRDRLDAFFEHIPSLASNQGPENLFSVRKGLDKSGEESIIHDESLPEESIIIAETSSESEHQVVATKTADAAMEDITLTKQFLLPVQNYSAVESLPAHQLRATRTPRKNETPTSVEKRTTPRKLRTPRTIISKTAKPTAENTPQQSTPEVITMPSSGRTPRTPRRALTPKVTMGTSSPKIPVARASPRKPRTPRKTPTPKVRKKAENPPSVPESTSQTVLPDTQSVPVEIPHSPSTSPQRSAGESSPSPDYQFPRINISATIKIRLQFNDEVLASVQTSPFASSSSTKLPRLTESESTGDNPSARDVVEDVRTPENLKQRSVRDQNTLTMVDISKSLTPAKNIEITSSHCAEQIPDDLLTEQKRDDYEKPLLSPESIHEPPEVNSFQDENSPLQGDVSITDNTSTPARPTEPQQTPSPGTEAAIEIDHTAQKLLDQLYGDEWKTPAVVKSLKKLNTTRVETNRAPAEESLMDFTKFHKSIRCDLESTRLPGAQESLDHVFKAPATEVKLPRTKREVKPLSNSERKPRREIKAVTPLERARQICDSDSSDSDFNASCDESWKEAFSHSSSDASDDSIDAEVLPPKTRKNNTKKTNKNKSSKDDIVYLDLSTDVVKVQETNESPCANQDEAFQRRLEELLDSYKCPDKKKLEGTPRNPKIKRKLFTPRFGEEDEASPVISARNDVKPSDDDDGTVTIKAPLPQMFEPINKHLESVKTGKPIFSLTTPKTPKTSKKNKENRPIGNAETPQTQPRKPLQRENTLDRLLLSAPCDKYGFLQSLDVTIAKKFCHPDALKYRDSYKANKHELAQKLFEIYNKNVFNNELDVGFVWNKKLLNTAGRCSCSTKAGKRFCRVELSDKVLTSADRLRCTLIHELCHAATWLYNGEHGHGATWKKWARRANGIFPELPKIGVCHEYDIDYKYTYKCTLCNAKSHAHSKSKKVENIRCAFCHGAIEVFLNKKDKDGNVLPTPVREATGFAKFVKDNYKKHKRPDLKHADVMKMLSNEFASLNVDGKK